MISPTVAVGYLALFAGVGLVFLFANLLVGKLVRPQDRTPEKLEVYECGEPTIGSSFVQFDIRFYVVALLFIIFDVEVALFFPWATIYGKSANLMDPQVKKVAAQLDRTAPVDQLTPVAADLQREMGIAQPQAPQVAAGPGGVVTPEQVAESLEASARRLVWLSLADILVFFAVLMVGFAYVWRRGDLDWVRAVSRARAQSRPADEEPSFEEAALTA
ncbi:MAG: NADH-quinone oxidoreductase subunit A [Pirellulales bacterium]